MLYEIECWALSQQYIQLNIAEMIVKFGDESKEDCGAYDFSDVVWGSLCFSWHEC